MKIYGLVSVWNDDKNLKQVLLNMAFNGFDGAVILTGRYKHFPLQQGLTDGIINLNTIRVVDDVVENHIRPKIKFKIIINREEKINEPWESEIEKRTKLLQLGQMLHLESEGEDIYGIVLDSDELFTSSPELNLRVILEHAPDSWRMLAVPIYERAIPHPKTVRFPGRIIRLPSPRKAVLEYRRTHYHIYRIPQMFHPVTGFLVNDEDEAKMVGVDVILWDTAIAHLTGNRNMMRRKASESYYKKVVEDELEDDVAYHQLIRANRKELGLDD